MLAPSFLGAVIWQQVAVGHFHPLLLAADRPRVKERVGHRHVDDEHTFSARTLGELVSLHYLRTIAVRIALIRLFDQLRRLDDERLAFPPSSRVAIATGQPIGLRHIAAAEIETPHVVVQLVNDRDLIGPMNDFHRVGRTAEDHGGHARSKAIARRAYRRSARRAFDRRRPYGVRRMSEAGPKRPPSARRRRPRAAVHRRSRSTRQ